MTDTPETDALRDEIWDTPYRDGDDFSKMLDHAKKLERQRDEAREQRDAFIKEIEIANERLRGKKHPDDNGIMVDGEVDIKQLLEQRDGLKSAADCASDLLYTAIAERDEARSRFNEIDLCQNGQSPCKWSLKLIHERDALVKALEECKEDSIELLGERSWWKDEPRSDYKKRYEETQNNIARADAALAAVKTTHPND
jgi:hypothetical protein